MTVPTEPRYGTAASANGDLVNRVQELRLDTQIGAVRHGGRGSWLPWVLCAMLAVAWVGVGVKVLRAPPAKTEGETAIAAGSSAGRHADKPVAPGEILFQLKGNLIPSLQIAVSPRDVAGELTSVDFYEGKLVKANDKLAELMSDQYVNRLRTDEAMAASSRAMAEKGKAGVTTAKARVAKALAVLAATRARVAEAEAVLVKAKNDMELADEQWKTKTISPQDYQKAIADLKVAEAKKTASLADVDAAAKEVESTEADVRTAEEAAGAAAADKDAADSRVKESKRMVENCTIRAPIDGTVLSKKADKGSLVNPLAFSSSNGGSSGSLCEIADLKKLEVEVDVPERQLARLLQPDPKTPGRTTPWDCNIVADAAPEKIYRGYVDRIMPVADDGKNVVRIRVRVYLAAGEIPGSLLRPKMSIVVTGYARRFEPSPNDQKWGDEPDSLK
jgi:multidrug efflux pump subunit AcrA (membrane-fusion protein)